MIRIASFRSFYLAYLETFLSQHMLLIVFIIALTMACLAGFEFFYLMYLETVLRQHKRRIAELERHCNSIINLLHETETKLEEQRIETKEKSLIEEEIIEEEMWPETIDDDTLR